MLGSAPELRIPFSPADSGGAVVAHQVIVKIAARTARSTYGVVALRGPRKRALPRVLRGSLAEGIEVEVEDGKASVDLHVIMERGVNLAQVSANLVEQVRYQLGDVGGLPLGEIGVRVEDLQD